MTQTQLQKIIEDGENISVEFKKGIQRMDIRDKIFREMAANCLIHREFTHSFPAKFLIFSDRVITENWTKPSGQNPVTLETLETHTKNPTIALVFKELGWIEELGSGRKNIMKYAPYYYNDYRIEIKNEEKFVFTLTYRGLDENVNEIARPLNDKIKYQKNTENQLDKILIFINEHLKDNVRPLKRPLNDNLRPLNDNIKKNLAAIVLLLLKSEGINRNDLITEIGIGRTSIFQCLQILRDADIVEYIGSKKTGGYYLTQRAKDRLQNQPLIM